MVKAKSGGRIEVQVSPSAQLGDDAAMVTQLRTGALDLSANSQGAVAAVVPAERWVTVEFDGSVNSKLPWGFRPNATKMRVRVGEQYEATYAAHNNGGRAIVGSATPSVAPARAR